MHFSVRDFAYAEDSELHYAQRHLLEEEDLEEEAEEQELNGQAVALFDFAPENDNEIALHAGQQLWINYRYGQGWLVAEDESGEIGLVPEEYVELVRTEEPKLLLAHLSRESDWEDEDEHPGASDSTGVISEVPAALDTTPKKPPIVRKGSQDKTADSSTALSQLTI